MNNKALVVLATVAACMGIAPAGAATLYTITDLGAFQNASGMPVGGLNEAGTVVGTGEGVSLPGVNRAFSWSTSDGLQDLTLLMPGATGSRAAGINDAGTVTGTAYGIGNGKGYTLSESGQLTFLASPADRSASPSNINNNGEVVGQTDGPGGTRAAYWDAAGNFVDLGAELGGFSAAYDINDNGDIVGFRGSDYRAFLRLADGTIIDLGQAPGKSLTYARAINNTGMVVGLGSAYFSPSEAFVWSAGTGYTMLGGGAQLAYDINDAGFVVGSGSIGGQTAAFIWSADGGTQDLNSLVDPLSGWQLQAAQAINETGQIAGFGLYQGTRRAFLLNPLAAAAVPEPASWAMLIAGFALVGGALRQRRTLSFVLA